MKSNEINYLTTIIGCFYFSPKTMTIKFLPFLLFICFPTLLTAQQFGGNPPSIKWMQINTDSLRVLFPKGHKQQALRVFNTSLYMNRYERSSIGSKTEKFNIILQPHTVISNGFVALAPFRSVFQTTPPSNPFSLGTNNWLSELSIHETWHALQNMNFKTGIGKTFHTLFGGTGQSFITHLLIPDWYWEGDAVFMETQLTREGRGRLPSFMAPFKSLWLADIGYTYAKIRNGSLKDLVPNKYALGYMMVGYGRNRYGYNFWQPVLQETLLNKHFIKKNNKQRAKRPFHLFKYGFYPLTAALKYNTGKRIKDFYQAANTHFKKQWQSSIKPKLRSSADTLKSPTPSTVLNYRYPTFTKEGELLAVKYGYAVNPAIVQINKDGNEHTITQIGNTLQHYYSYGGQKIVWAEYRPDIRWGWKSYSIIRLHDMQKNKTITLSHKSRYFSPALSTDGKRIIAVEATSENGCRLVLLDATDGHRIKTIPNPNHYFFTYPVFGNTKNIVIAGAKDSLSNMALVKTNIQTGKETNLTPFAPKAIGVPVNTKENIFFPAAYNNGIQLYALRKTNHQIYRIATRPMGNYSLAVDTTEDKIIFDEYTVNGFQLLSRKMDTSKWETVSSKDIKQIRNPYIAKALNHDQNGSILNKIPTKIHPSKSYHPIKHLFKVHSWSFLSLYPEISLFLQSGDLMGTLQAAAGAGYNLNENTPFVEANFLYGGIFPYLKAGVRKTFGRNAYLSESTPVYWDEMNWYSGFDIPLNISGNLYQRQLSIGGTFHHSTLNYHPSQQIKKQSKDISYYSARLSFNQLRHKTVQDIYPKFGLAFSLIYNHTLGKAGASQLTSNLNLFLPGIFPNHSLYFISAYSERKNSDKYKFNDNFSYAAGYHSVPYKGIYTLGVNYQMPILYPDIGLTWIYLLRVRLHGFYNYSHAELLPGLSSKYGTFRSAGLSLYFDTHLFNAVTVPIGIRYAQLFDTDPGAPGKDYKFSISFPINLF